jgi:(p)ppGpp synthase/HD superfamily hydrolase
MLGKAIKIAVEAHTGQKDKAGEPYIYITSFICNDES